MIIIWKIKSGMMAVSMTVGSINVRLLVAIFLSCCYLSAASEDDVLLGRSTNDVMSDFNSIFYQLKGFTTSIDDVQQVNRRQTAENISNSTDVCSDGYFSVQLNRLTVSCLNSLSNLSVANATYLASEGSVMDIDNVCQEGCAGVFLDYDETCPEFLPNFSTYLRGICSRNAHNDKCAFSVMVNAGSRVYKKCFIETNAFDRCRSRCKNALRDFSADLGCCINTFYNDTYTFFANLQRLVPNLNYSINPSLWDACGIPYPGECSPYLFSPPRPSSTAVTPTPTSTPTPNSPSLCISTEETTLFSDSCAALLLDFQTPSGLKNIAMSDSNISELCSEGCGGSYVEQCNGANDDTSMILELFCGQYNNEFCGGVIVDSYTTLLQNLSLNCNYSSSSDCNAFCHSALVNVGEKLGCCSHALTLTSVSEHAQLDLLDGRLWSSCDLQPPQKCPNPFMSDLPENQNIFKTVWPVGVSVVLVLVVTLTVMIVVIAARNRRKNKDTIGMSTGDDLDLNPNQLYTSGVTISNPLPATRENSYAPHTPRAITASSESLLELFDNGRTSANTRHSPSQSEMREEGEEEGEQSGVRSPGGRNEVEGQEDSGDERGFDYTTTAYIARQLRSGTRGGSVEVNGDVVPPAMTTIQPAIRSVVYQEPFYPAHPALNNAAAVTCSSPVASCSPQYHYVRSDNPLYHYARDSSLFISNNRIPTTDSYIETEPNISYNPGTTSTTPHPSTHPPSSLVTSMPIRQQKPPIKPRTKSVQPKMNKHHSDSEDENMKMVKNISYSLQYGVAPPASPPQHSTSPTNQENSSRSSLIASHEQTYINSHED